MKMNYRFTGVMLLAGALLVSSCKKSETEKTATGPSLPSGYTFENVNYKGQTVRIKLLGDIMDAIEASEDSGSNPVSKASLMAIYQNTNNLYSEIATDKRLSDKIETNFGSRVVNYFDILDARGGLYQGEDRVVTADEIDLPELIEKTIMGGVFYYNALNYLNNEVPAADNQNVVAGEGTKMQHNFDEAFGYFGAVTDYNSKTDLENSTNSDNKFFAKYAATLDKDYLMFTSAPTDFTKTIFDAFIAGRDAINRKSYTSRNNSIKVITETWDKIIGAAAIRYAQKCKNDLDNASHGSFIEHWAELKGFVEMTQLNGSTKLSTSEYTAVMNLIGNKPADVETPSSPLNQVIAKLKAAYNF